jgi:hypothetical protein
MTLTVAESLKDTWMPVFQRKGGNGLYTRLFDNLDPSQRSMVLAEFKLGESELPVIGSIKDPAHWLVLTTGRLAWSLDGKRQEVAASAMRDATANLKQLQRTILRQPSSCRARKRASQETNRQRDWSHVSAGTLIADYL